MLLSRFNIIDTITEVNVYQQLRVFKSALKIKKGEHFYFIWDFNFLEEICGGITFV